MSTTLGGFHAAVLTASVSVACAVPEREPPSLPELIPVRCVREDGTATPLWTEGLTGRIGAEAAAQFAAEVRPFDEDEWAVWNVLLAALPEAARRSRELGLLFDVELLDARVAVGNRGGNDAFAWRPDVIAVDAQAFVAAYGVPEEGATERFVRLLAHEYLHLVTYRAFPHHESLRRTPLDRALWTLFFEGMGDFVSASARWHPAPDGLPSETAAAALAELEPEFVERLEALEFADEADEPQLRERISMGRFDRKWGSLPVAIWLHAEAARVGEAAALSELIRLGPDGVLPLALRHIRPELRPRLEAIRARRVE